MKSATLFVQLTLSEETEYPLFYLEKAIQQYVQSHREPHFVIESVSKVKAETTYTNGPCMTEQWAKVTALGSIKVTEINASIEKELPYASVVWAS